LRNVITVTVLITLFSLSIGLYQVFKYKPDYSYIVTKEPIQENIINKIENFKKDDFIVVPLKNYEIEARILSKKKYTIGEDSDFSTYDLALGWKEMSDIHYLEKIKISQRNRWYYWRTKDRSIPREIISYNSSNHHIVHANEKIKKQLSNLKEHQVIKMTGYLINAKNINYPNIELKSSLTRKDTGAGACEVFYVDYLEVIN
tara:strand:- start:1605 stop:2210 length:606 start_codon:yes stop_codon:yes gene_type:complete